MPHFLEVLPIYDLRDPKYQIAVLRNSFLHLLANTRLGRPDTTLVLCSSDDEALERLTLKSVAGPVHVFLTNSMRAMMSAKEHPKDYELLFHKRKSLIDLVEVGIAVRPDWPEIPPVLNEAIRFLVERGVVGELFGRVFKGDWAEVAEVNA